MEKEKTTNMRRITGWMKCNLRSTQEHRQLKQVLNVAQKRRDNLAILVFQATVIWLTIPLKWKLRVLMVIQCLIILREVNSSQRNLLALISKRVSLWLRQPLVNSRRPIHKTIKEILLKKAQSENAIFDYAYHWVIIYVGNQALN